MLLSAQNAKKASLLMEGELCYFNNPFFNEDDPNGKSEPFFVGEVVLKD